MRKIMLFTLVLLSAVVFAATSYGGSVPFGDNSRYWGDGPAGLAAGWSANQAWNTDVPNPGWNGNGIDVIGDPDITGGTATFNSTSGNLTRITFNYTAPLSNWTMLAPGNLFINVLNGDNDTTWDYVVTTMGTPISNPSGNSASLAATNYNLYNISNLNIDAKRDGALNTNGTYTSVGNDANYVLSGADLTGAWAGYYLRNYHPIGIVNTVLTGITPGSAYFSGFPGDVNNNATPHPTGTSYYDFGESGLDTGGHNIIIGWEMTCANDVVYEQVNHPPIITRDQVPEPTTLLLLGLGLIGVAAIRRKF